MARGLLAQLSPLLHSTATARLPRAGRVRSAAGPYDGVAVTQDMLRADIGRRLAECLAIGWLGRGYALLPALFDAVLPNVFCLSAYSDQPCVRSERPDGSTLVEVTLKESSVTEAVGMQLRALELLDFVSRELLGFNCWIPNVLNTLRNDPARPKHFETAPANAFIRVP